MTTAFEITEQSLDAGKIVHTGWTLNGQDTRLMDSRPEVTCDVSVVDYFDLSGKFLGADENGVEPTFETAEVDYTTLADRVYEYRFASDSEHGSIMARDFVEAKAMLCAMINGTDGGEGWVEDTDGYRFEYSN